MSGTRNEIKAIKPMVTFALPALIAIGMLFLMLHRGEAAAEVAWKLECRKLLCQTDIYGVTCLLCAMPDGGAALINASGQEVWRIDVFQPGRPVSAVTDVSGNFFVGSSLGTVQAISSSGELLWIQPVSVADKGRVKLDSLTSVGFGNDGLLYAASLEGSVLILTADGKVVSRFDSTLLLHENHRPWASSEGHVYLITAGADAHVFNGNGEQVWVYDQC